MSESYQSKQERRQRLLESLPEGLRPHVSVRNIEAVAALSPQAQTRLLEAVQAGLKRLPRAIEQLRANPETSVADLLDPPAQPEAELPAQNATSIGQDVADLIQECFPDMPRVSAEAKVSPTLALTETCGTPGSSYSTGSSTVRIFSRPVWIRSTAA